MKEAKGKTSGQILAEFVSAMSPMLLSIKSNNAI
jgi:hypothetical protein